VLVQNYTGKRVGGLVTPLKSCVSPNFLLFTYRLHNDFSKQKKMKKTIKEENLKKIGEHCDN
jgi:hypothetical protein